MTGPEVPVAGGNPFSIRAVLALVVFGAVTFVALLWMIGAGMGAGSVNDGGNHAGSKGLTGFAALSTMLEKQGYDVRRTRNEAAFEQPGLLVLTPSHLADGAEIGGIIARRRYHGPTLLVLPKWLATPVPAALRSSDVKDGWVALGEARSPNWGDDVAILGDLDLAIGALPAGGGWRGFGRGGTLPDRKAVQSVSTGRIIGLVRDNRGQMLAGYLEDGSAHPSLAAAAGIPPSRTRSSSAFPVVVVAEPDLLNNYGFADRERAMLALDLVRATTEGEPIPVNFDLTLNGHGRAANLLTLAFSPPFLAATLCLLLAALVIGWRAFLRFGSPRKRERAIAFGKRALVGNAAGLLRRARRLHLIAGPYVDRARDRLVRALALPRGAGREATDAAIDRAMSNRAPGSPSYTMLTQRLLSARTRHDIVKAARALHALERTLIR